YLAGLVAGNRRGGTGDNVLRSMDSLAWLAQSGMFLMLGLLVTPSELIGDGLINALLVALFLMVVARPLSVWVSLLPFRFKWREKLFISWTGLRGAVPIVLAVFPLLAGVGQTRLLFDITLVVVLISLLAQGASLRYMARWLKVSVPATTPPKQMVPLAATGDRYVMQFEVDASAKAEGQRLGAITTPRITPLLIIRNKEFRNLAEDPVIEAGDLVTWLAPVGERDYLSDLCHRLSKDEKRFYGDFFVRGGVPVEQLVAVYGIEQIDPLLHGLTVEAVFERQFGQQAVVGDTVRLGGLKLRARTVEQGRVLLIGIKLPK
ncbi:MAG TPA: potassium/proton antiporter, partial [Alcanivorax sp.]|nr:potassium/proton antiporter [Alcanivorax sp.]